MMRKQLIAFLAGGLLILAPVSPVFAVGEGVKVGPTLLFPGLVVSGTYDDNVNLSSHDPISDYIISVSPSLRVVVPVRHYFLNLSGGLDFLRYLENEGQDSTDWFAAGAVGAELPAGLSFKLSDKHTYRYLVGSQEYGPSEGTTVNNLNVDIAYRIRTKLLLELQGLRDAYTFDISHVRERIEYIGKAVLSYRFHPNVSATFEGVTTDFQYDSNTAQDGASLQLALGATWDVTAKSTGTIRVGYEWKTYDVENEEIGFVDGEFYIVGVNVIHAFTPKTSIELDITHGSQESDFPNNPYYLRSTAGLTLVQRMTSKVYFRVGGRYGNDDYPNYATYTNPYDSTDTATGSGYRNDTTLTGRAAVGFDALRWLTIELNGSLEKRTVDNFKTFEYNDTRVSLNVKAAF